MRYWVVVRQVVGFLILFVTFCTGMLLGWSIYWIRDHSVPYIDQPAAIRAALGRAHDLCVRHAHSRPVDCTYHRVRTEREDKDGWRFTLWSADGRGIGMIVDRRGKIQAGDDREVVAPG